MRGEREAEIRAEVGVKEAGMEVIELLYGKYLTCGEGIITLTQCLASLIASNPDKRKRNEALAAVLMSLTEMVATFGEAIEAGAVRMPTAFRARVRRGSPPHRRGRAARSSVQWT